MYDHLQMTFIPTLPDDRNLFIWLTDEKGNPIEGKNKEVTRTLRYNPIWREAFDPQPPLEFEAAFQVNGEVLTTNGLLFPLHDIFQVILNPLFNKSTNVQYGETVFFFKEIADSIQVLLESGHFYPTMYHLEKGGETYFFGQWLPDSQLLEQSGLKKTWLQHLPQLALSAKILEDIKVMQWLHLLICFWTDAIIRQTADPKFDSLIDDLFLQDSKETDYAVDWFEQMTSSRPNFFHVSSSSEEIQTCQNLEAEINRWTAAVSGTQPAYLLNSMRDFKKDFMRPHITPNELELRLEPKNRDQPFDQDNPWYADVKVHGLQSGDHGIFDLDDAMAGNPTNFLWLMTKLDVGVDLIPTSIRMQLYRHTGEQLMLTTQEVYDLYRHEESLEALAITCRFPSWMKIQKADKGVDLQLEMDTQDSMFGLASLINYNWRISVGDLALTAAEFKHLVKQQQPFIKYGDGWIQLPMDQMMEAYQKLDETEQLVGKKPQVADALRLAASRGRKRKKDIDVQIGDLLENYLTNLLKKPTKNLKIPESFAGKLRPYQKKGFTWLSQLREKGAGCCLADDMGLGKTIQAIAYLTHSLQEPVAPVRKQKEPALILCPTSLLANWEREIHKFAPGLNVYVHHGGSRFSAKEFKETLSRFDVVITSYTLFTREAEHLCKYIWSSAILDEAQAIKNPQAKKSRAVRGIVTRHRIVLTGTPMENRLEELWSIMEFLNPGYLGSMKKFREQFARPIERQNDQAKAQLLTQIIQPFLLRREKTDKRIIKDLPEKIETKEFCYLSKSQASLYQSVVDKLVKNVSTAEGMKRKGLILSTLTRLKQVCDHPSLVTGDAANMNDSGKIERFFEIVDALFQQNEKVLVFTQYVKMGHLLVDSITSRHPDANVFFLHGSLTADKREKMIEQFRSNEGQKTLFVLSLKAGGLGLNLTEANHVIHYDRWWNPAVEEQATDRAYRIGQNRNVQVHKLICEGTLEQRIDDLIEKKKALTQQILGKGESWVTEMNDKEVYELIRLREKVMSS